jgi:hypothetical protein
LGSRKEQRRVARKKADVKFSNFFVLIQTNRRIVGDSSFVRFVTRFDEVLNEMFDTDNNFKRMGDNMIKFGTMAAGKWIPMEPGISEAKWNSRNIKRVQVNGVIEEGGSKVGGRIHSHHLVQIDHTTSLQIDCRKVESYINNAMAAMGVKGTFCRSRIVNKDFTNILAYMGKDVIEDDELLAAAKIAQKK